MNLRPMPETASCPTGLKEPSAQQNQTVLEGKMNRKSLNHNMDREEKDATKSRPSPADFPLGSLQSRVAARIMQEEKALHTSEQERRKQIDAACAAWIISHAQGPMYWLRNWTKTENYQWRDQGLNPVAPFPYKPWAQLLELLMRVSPSSICRHTRRIPEFRSMLSARARE